MHIWSKTLNWYFNYVPSTFERNLAQRAHILMWLSSCYSSVFSKLEHFLPPVGRMGSIFPLVSRCAPSVCFLCTHTYTELNAKYQPLGSWLNADCIALIFSTWWCHLPLQIEHLKKQGWSAHKLGAKQDSRKTGANSRKRAQIKKSTTCVFRSALFSILSMRAFGWRILMSPMFGDPFVLLTTSSLSAFDYNFKILKEFFSRQSGLLVCGATSDIWTSSEHHLCCISSIFWI